MWVQSARGSLAVTEKVDRRGGDMEAQSTRDQAVEHQTSNLDPLNPNKTCFLSALPSDGVFFPGRFIM
jgi:hypothetical protein